MNVNQLATLLNSVVFLIIGVGIFTVLIRLGNMIDKIDNTFDRKEGRKREEKAKEEKAGEEIRQGIE